MSDTDSDDSLGAIMASKRPAKSPAKSPAKRGRATVQGKGGVLPVAPSQLVDPPSPLPTFPYHTMAYAPPLTLLEHRSMAVR